MRAITYPRYGDPSVLALTDLPMPKVAPGAALVRVHHGAVNPVDWKVMAGGLDPLMDVVFPVIPGWDVSGVVEAVGPDTPEFRVGDRVAAYARKDVVQGATHCVETGTYSAMLPGIWAMAGTVPKTRCPTLKPLTSAPTSATTPEKSSPIPRVARVAPNFGSRIVTGSPR